MNSESIKPVAAGVPPGGSIARIQSWREIAASWTDQQASVPGGGTPALYGRRDARRYTVPFDFGFIARREAARRCSQLPLFTVILVP
jgi:hypothetical protein